jgi:hypothetical protein
MGKPAPVNVRKAAALLEAGDGEALLRIIDTLPPTRLGAAARGMICGERLDIRLMALNIVADELARGIHPAGGGALAEAALTVARRHLDDPALSQAIIPEQTAAAAGALVQAHILAGRHEAVVALADEMEALLEGRTDGVRLVAMRLRAVEALIALGRLEEGERRLAAIEAAGCADPTLPFVRRRLRDRLREVTILADTRSADQRAADDDRDAKIAMATALRDLLGQDPDMASLGPALAALVEQARTEPTAATASAAFAKSNSMIDKISGMVALSGSELHEWQRRVRNRSSLFLDRDQRDPAVLQPALAEFRDGAAWFDGHGQREDANNARWCAYLALRRMGRFAEALTATEELCSRLEEDRARIADPLRRASHFAAFPHVHSAMVECAAELDDPRRMLAAMEGAKGRALGDLLAARAQEGKAALLSAPDPDRAAALARKLRIAYASYFATEDAVFAVCVDPSGGWHWRRIDLDQAARRRIGRRLEPGTWVVPTRRDVFDLGAALSPLAGWLAPLADSGHLVVSPDGELHQWPLHMADADGTPLAVRCGVSRVHGLEALRRIAAAKTRRPSRRMAVFIPTRDEAELADKSAAMQRTAAAMGAGDIVAPETAGSDFFANLDAANTILHVNAHGVFPEEVMTGGIDPNPYRSAGMVLAEAGALPPRAASAWPHRLTPALVLESDGLRLDGAAVVLQGCVSGLAKEGLGGDALGLEWALLAKGAASVLASHWYVDYRSAGAFCRHFHEAWLGRGQTRIAAWRDAVMRTRNDPEGGAAHDWAAFSLSGDWR